MAKWASTDAAGKAALYIVVRAGVREYQSCRANGIACFCRFWNTADTPEMWDLLIEYGVDYVNVDALQQFR